MANYWVKGYKDNPQIGELRHNTWNLNYSHNGSTAGGYAYAIQRDNGVDVFVAVNQRNNKKCAGEEKCGFAKLDDVILEGLEEVDWSQLQPFQELVP